MEPAAPPPPRTRRVLAARAALTVLGLIVLVLVTFVLSNPLTMLVFLLTVAVALAVGSASGWWALTTHRIWKRRANVAVIGLVVLVLLAALVAAVLWLGRKLVYRDRSHGWRPHRP